MFGTLDIGSNPTENRHSFVVLRFDFSAVHDAPETLEREFEDYCRLEIEEALERNPDLFPADAVARVLDHPSASGKLNALFREARRRGVRLYLLIDEYDNFANTILAHHGADAYHELTHGSGFYCNFFAALKAGAGRSGGGLERLFVTGVSPITLDDVTSGFNIGKNISLLPEFNAVLGFTEGEVRGLLQTYRKAGALGLDEDVALDTMREWYDGYRFAKGAEETVYNTDMVLYFLNAAMPNKPMPDDLIDVNVRIDYGKLRHLLTVSRGHAQASGAARASASDTGETGEGVSDVRLNGNFDLLRQIVGEGQADADVQASFPLERLAQRDNFLSLLHYFGLLTIRDIDGGRTRLHIPNQTVRQLLYGHLRDAYDDVGVLSVDLVAFADALWRMARDGDWHPVFDFLRNAIAKQTSIRDYLDGEKIIQGFLAAYLGTSRHFLVRTEPGTGQGLRRHRAGASGGAIPGLSARVLARAQVPQAGRGRRAGQGAGGRGTGRGTVAAVLGGRAVGAGVSFGRVHSIGGGVPWMGDGALPRDRTITGGTAASIACPFLSNGWADCQRDSAGAPTPNGLGAVAPLKPRHE